MKKNIVLFLFIFLGVTSCLKSNLEDLPEFEENDITGVTRVEYRFISDEVSLASGQKIVKFVNLIINKVEINKTDKTVIIDVLVPNSDTTFTQEQRAKVSKDNLVVIVNLSTAARIFPIEGSPKLGVPANWSMPNKYSVVAADGTEAQWVIQIRELQKP